MNSSYIQATSISCALEALNNNKPAGRILAGGTNIIPKIKSATFKKDVSLIFIDIKEIEELKHIRMDNDHLVIGPTVNLNELLENEFIKNHYPILIQAAEKIGSMELRNRATVGGNLCNKNVRSDLLAPLLALGSQVEISDVNGSNLINLKEWCDSSMWSKIGRETVLTAIRVPIPEYTWGYTRYSKESMGRAYVIVVLGLKIRNDFQGYYYKIVLGGSGVRPKEIEGNITKQEIGTESTRLKLASEILDRFNDSRNNQDSYWNRLTTVMLADTIGQVGATV